MSKYATSSKSTVSWFRFNKWFNKYSSLQSRSTWTHVPARIVFVCNEIFQSKKNCITSSFSIFLSVKLSSVNSRRCPSSVNLTVDINIKSRLTYLSHMSRDISGEDGDRYITTCSHTSTTEIASWTLPRFSALNGELSDNMTSDLSKTWLTIRFTSCYAHLRDEAGWMIFLKNVSNWGNWVLMKLSVWIYRFAFSWSRGFDERFLIDAHRVTMTKWSVIKKKNHDLYKKEDPIARGCRYHARCVSAAIMTRSLSSQESLDDVVLVTSCADVDIVLTYLTIFVVTSVCQLLRRTLYPGTVIIDDVDISSGASLSTDDTYYIA